MRVSFDTSSTIDPITNQSWNTLPTSHSIINEISDIPNTPSTVIFNTPIIFNLTTIQTNPVINV